MKRIEMNILYKNKIFINMKIQKNLKYSAKKRQVKPNLPYSILQPLTNSDSPSTKSKGVRPSSIKHMAINKKSKKKQDRQKENIFKIKKNENTKSKDMPINITRMLEMRAKDDKLP